MSSYVFPDFPLREMPLDRGPGYNTTIYRAPGGQEQRVSRAVTPRGPIRMKLTLRDDVAAPAPWAAYSELSLLRWFHDTHYGAGDSFLVADPLQRPNLLAYSQDFSQSVWALYYLKPAVTGSKTAPDGTATAQEFASADYAGNNISGVCQVAAASVVDGPKTVSIWARCVSGTLVCSFGTWDGNVEAITLTTTWQRFTHYDSAWTRASQAGRIFQVSESTLANQAWQVWGAQAEPGSTARLYVPTGANPITGQVRVRFESDNLVLRRLASGVWQADIAMITVV